MDIIGRMTLKGKKGETGISIEAEFDPAVDMGNPLENGSVAYVIQCMTLLATGVVRKALSDKVFYDEIRAIVLSEKF